MDLYPVGLKLDDARSQLTIEWSDGRRDHVAVRLLRDRCPCATCREKRQAPPPASPLVVLPAESAPPTIASMRPVGNYAYSIDFSDGHNTGIYTFEYLRELGAT